MGVGVIGKAYIFGYLVPITVLGLHETGVITSATQYSIFTVPSMIRGAVQFKLFDVLV